MEYTKECASCGIEFEPDNMGETLCDDCRDDGEHLTKGEYPRNTDIDSR